MSVAAAVEKRVEITLPSELARGALIGALCRYSLSGAAEELDRGVDAIQTEMFLNEPSDSVTELNALVAPVEACMQDLRSLQRAEVGAVVSLSLDVDDICQVLGWHINGLEELLDEFEGTQLIAAAGQLRWLIQLHDELEEGMLGTFSAAREDG